jgi:leucyl/phenylalanyl-tRNA--protein transferase
MAYQRGIFPGFPRRPDFVVVARSACRAVACAVSPQPQHEAFHAKSPYRVTLNHAFGQVIEGCASDRHEGTWITRDIITAYHRLHELGYAHSIEVWDKSELVGGMYGVAQGTLFCGESMFSRAVNASKTALLVFCQEFANRGGQLIDCQVLNEHTASLGAVEIARRDYIEHLDIYRRRSSRATSGTKNALSAQCLNVFRIFFMRVL